ncbi:hypothetical protein GCM10011611_02750 [Aliidongia dinghuensis]|uniref:Uncharacterized protein n=1 Tax=Aliidongia dinghuensis TaxID=1867774 RepID=A0A8J2YPC0_9PROT|nr:hypothetical protein [Aliidongia dinghuensis]GGF00604.1 hypothetical protein GCM10011611_02750 [Aliidongia dinghuensis]
MKRIVSVALLALVLGAGLSPAAYAAPNCTTGKPCGDTCIAKDKTCNIAPKPAKECKTGKLCGDTCIAKDKVCKK